MTQPRLTLVTVTKNCALTVERTFRSVRAVKSSAIEYLVIDGVSTDGTLDLIRAYSDVIDHTVSEPDTGIYNAMNKGVKLARGAYLLFINGDDELIAEGFPALMEGLESRLAEIVSATTLVGSREMPSETLVARPHRLPFYNSIPHPSTCVATPLMRRYGGFREDLRIASDYDLFLRAHIDRRSFASIPAVTALHHRGGASGNTERSAIEVDMIRKARLGWRYPILEILLRLNRLRHRMMREVANAPK